MHQTEAHCDDSHPENDVQRHEDELEVDKSAEELILVHDLISIDLDRVSRNHVTEPDGGEGDEAEVEAVQERPSLPLAKEDRAPADVAYHHDDAQGYRNGDSTERLGSLTLDVIIIVLKILVILIICANRTLETVSGDRSL